MNPTGSVTFLFTDIEGSTKISQEYADSMQEVLRKHNSILYKAVESNNGIVFKTVGDAFCCAFQNAGDALKSAVEAQRFLSEENWEKTVIKVRMGIHSGQAEWDGKDYMGYITLARTSRIMSVAYGEQIIISDSAYEAINKNLTGQYKFRDLGERRLKDVIKPVRLFQVISNGLREDFPPLKTLDARPNNLPAQLTSFIGREADLKKIKDMLNNSRLVTVLGTGGAGKTRLTIQTAADVIDDFANGVWLIELASLSDPEYLTQRIAGVFRLLDQPNQSTEETLINFLSEKEILLIFDNCEHIIDSCSEMAQRLLTNAPRLKIIASSREVLRCRGEKTYRITSLKHPDPGKDISPLKISQYEAVRLFTERSLAVRPDFRVNDENAQALAQICQRLDGNPLAIELAAAKTKILSVELINERLNDRFKLLTGGNRSDMPRQQTLRALIDWSYDLLNEKEKTLFKRLSVFSDGWTLDAAEKICSDEIIESEEVLDILTSLFEKSMINTSESSGTARFKLLDSLKEYGSQKLNRNYDIFRKHFEYFSGIASSEEMISKGIDEIGWVKAAESDSENLRQAVNWSIENETEKAAKIVYDVSNLYEFTGFVHEAGNYCMKLLEKNKFPDECSKAKIQSIIATLFFNMGNIPEALKYVNESLIVFRKLNMKLNIVKDLNLLFSISKINLSTGNENNYLEEALALCRENNFKNELITTLYNFSFKAGIADNIELKKKYRDDALKLSREINNTTMTITILASLGITETLSGDKDKARSYFEESFSLAKQMNNQNFISINLSGLGNIYLKEKDFENAEYYLSESVRSSKEYGLINTYPLLKNLAVMYNEKGEYEKALMSYRESLKYGLKFGSNFFTKEILIGAGISYFNSDQPELSLKMFCILNSLQRDIKDPYSLKTYNEKSQSYILKLRDSRGDEIFEKFQSEADNIDRMNIEKFVLELMENS